MIIIFRFRIRELRESAGYKSQQSFADAFGIAQSTVGGWESGKREPNYETTIRLADFFGVSVDYLLGRTDQKEVLQPSSYWDGQTLIDLRKSRGETSLYVAESIGISESLYNRIESSLLEPTVSILIRLADHFCTDVDCILGRFFFYPDKNGNISTFDFQISESEKHLIEQYRSATPKEQSIINSILLEYGKKLSAGESAV